MRKKYARGLAACLMVLLLFQGEAMSSLAAVISGGLSSAGHFERRIYHTVPVASPSEATPGMAEEDEAALGGGLGGQGSITGATDLGDLRAQRLQELIGDLSVSLPTQVSFSIDLFESLGKGQVYSEDYCFQNFSKVDVLIRLENIRCEFSDKSHYQSLDSPEQMDRTSPKKQVYLYLEQIDGITDLAETDEKANVLPAQAPGTEDEGERPLGPGVVITDVPKEDSYSFILSADPNGENNQAHFRMTGAVNELSKYTWRSGEIRVKADFSIEPLIDEEVLRLLDEEIQSEEALDEEILDEDELVWRLAQEEAERRRMEQEAAEREKAESSAAGQPVKPNPDASEPADLDAGASQPSVPAPETSSPSDPETESDAQQPPDSKADASQPTESEKPGDGQILQPEGGQDSGGEPQRPELNGNQDTDTGNGLDAGQTEGSVQVLDASQVKQDESEPGDGQADELEQGSDASEEQSAEAPEAESGIGETSDES